MRVFLEAWQRLGLVPDEEVIADLETEIEESAPDLPFLAGPDSGDDDEGEPEGGPQLPEEPDEQVA